MSLVSIIIPAFNQGRFVAQAIESALAQTHPWIEVVVVNDGSTDDTADVLRAFKARGNVVVVHQPNSGLPAARNRGWRESRGEYLCFLDADDYLAPTHIERLLAAFDGSDDLAMTYCDVQMVDVTGNPSSAFSVGTARRTLSGDIFESLLIGGYFPPHTVLVRRDVVDRVGEFDLELGGHADYEMWLRISAAGYAARYVDERLAHYRVYDGTMSRDLTHMRATRTGALERVSRQFPDRMARGLSAVQEVAVDLHQVNAWMREQWDTVLANAGARASAPTWVLIEHVDAARLTHGSSEQLGIWDVPDNGTLSRCLFLHPPATLSVPIPTGDAGRLTASLGLHPDVWNRPDADACVFTLTVDGIVTGSVLLDPSHRESDRRWFTIGLDVPASASGEHVLIVETAAPGSGFHAWALLKDVTFHARGA